MVIAEGKPAERAAWVSKNHAEPTEVIAPMVGTLPQAMRILLTRMGGERQTAVIAALKQEKADRESANWPSPEA